MTAPVSAPEREALLLLARLHLSAGEAERLAALLRAADPARLLALTERGGVTGFLARHLADIADAPPALRDPVLAAARAHARDALALTRELLHLLALLEAAGVRALPYKGPTLGQAAYGTPGLRRFTDLDLLVREADLPAAGAALSAAGYLPGYRFPARPEALFRRVDGDYPFVGAESGTRVELKLRASSRRFGARLEADDLLARAGHLLLAGRAVPAPAADDLGVVLCVHAAKHRWSRLEWLVALAELLRGGSLIPAALLARAERLGARRAVLLGLRLAGTLLRAPVGALPAARGIPALAAEAEARIVRPLDAPPEQARDRLRFALRTSDTLRDGILGLARWLFIPTPEDWKSAPALPLPVLAAVRPLRLLAGGGDRPGVDTGPARP